MWLTEQFNSFLTLGLCKEYLSMARQKSTSGSKTPRAKKAEEVSVSVTPEVASVNPPVAQVAAAEIKAEIIKPEPHIAAETAKMAERKAAAEPKPFEVRKPEQRKNLVPINLDEEIRRRAYELYQMRGAESSNPAEDWLVAEREVMQRYHQQSA
jgi:hypothetical protein